MPTLHAFDHATLDAFHAGGWLPHRLARLMSLADADGLIVHHFPAVDSDQDILPAGYGLIPDSIDCPFIQIRADARDTQGRPIPKRTIGMIGCIWLSRRGRCVYRTWWYNPDATNPDAKPDPIGPIDVYSDMVIGVFSRHRDANGAAVAPRFPWSVIRLDTPNPSE